MMLWVFLRRLLGVGAGLQEKSQTRAFFAGGPGLLRVHSEDRYTN